jgi:hypothetical protein
MNAKLIALLLTAGCATYSDQSLRMRNLVSNGNPQEALGILDDSQVAHSKSDEVLFRMERGMLQYLKGDYEKAAKDWEKSYYRSEELYTVSFSKTAASVIVSENMTDYEGEDHERVMVPVFSALSFFSTGQLNAALVEIRRAYNLITKLKLDSDAGRPRIDGFPFLISGLLYEAGRNWDAAIVEYRKALKFYRKAEWSRKDGISELTADSLWRIAEFRNRKDVIEELAEYQFSRPHDSLQTKLESGEVIVLIESGQSPVKVPRDFPVDLGDTVVNIAFPEYQAITNADSETEIRCNNAKCSSTSKATDVGAVARRSLEHRRIKDFAKMTARLIIKEQSRRAAKKHLGEIGGLAVMLAGLATERADTRSWTLLPENIQIARISVPANKPVKLEVSCSNPIGQTAWEVQLPAGKKQLLRVRTMH